MIDDVQIQVLVSCSVGVLHETVRELAGLELVVGNYQALLGLWVLLELVCYWAFLRPVAH